MEGDASDQWDDTELLEAFEDAIKTHKRKGKRNNKRSRSEDGEKYVYYHNDDQEYNNNVVNKQTKTVHVSIEENNNTTYEYEPGQVTESAVETNAEYFANAVSESVMNENSSSSQFYADQFEQQYHASSNINSVQVSKVDIESALADMLHAWYQSGYMTGRYHTILELQQEQNKQKNF